MHNLSFLDWLGTVCFFIDSAPSLTVCSEIANEALADHKPIRSKAPDVYKGLAILGVITTHLALLQNGTDGVEGDPSPAVQFMFSGLFVLTIMSGYFYKPGRSFVQNVRKRVILVLSHTYTGWIKPRIRGMVSGEKVDEIS